MQAKVSELEEGTVSLEMRVEEAEGNLAAAQAEAETAVTNLDSRVTELSSEHTERLGFCGICTSSRGMKILFQGIS